MSVEAYLPRVHSQEVTEIRPDRGWLDLDRGAV